MSANTISIDTQHGDMIHDVQLDYYGKILATCSSDNTIRIYSIEEGVAELITEIGEHTGPVWRLSWSHPKFGSLLASCSYDGTVKVFSISKDKSYSVVYSYSGHKASVNSVSWAPYEYGLCLMAASADGSISCHFKTNETEWNSQMISVCRQGCSSVSWCPFRPSSSEGVNLLRVAVGGGDNCIYILRCANTPINVWEVEVKLREHTDRIRDVNWCPFVGFASNMIASCGRDNYLRIWTQHPNEMWRNCFSYQYNEPVWRLSWSLTGNLLAVSYGINGVDMWKEMLDGSWKIVNKKHEVQ